MVLDSKIKKGIVLDGLGGKALMKYKEYSFIFLVQLPNTWLGVFYCVNAKYKYINLYLCE